MKSWEQQLDILLDGRNGLSFRETARRVGCDPRTAKKYIEHPELLGQKRKSTPRPSVVDAFRDQIAAYLHDEHGNHQATWIHDQLVKSGYTGGYEIVKRVVRTIKGHKQQLAYIRFETLPGAQAQMDFGEFQITLPDGQVKTYYLFAMILGFSRKLFACLLERCDLPSFLEAHILAFEHFGGVPQEILYDRMRNVYIRDICDTPDLETSWHGVGKPLFTQSLMTLAVHYGFAPRVAPAYAPWVKGKIERPMDFIREGFWHGYEFSDLLSANEDLGEWLALKDQRVHGTTHERVDIRFTREQPHLHALPPLRCDVSLRLSRRVRKDCTISVEANRFIVPHTLVGQDLLIRLKDKDLRIFADGELVVNYVMPEGKGHLVGLEKGFYEALRADREMQARKFGNRGKNKKKGRAQFKKTISPIASRHSVLVEPIAPHVRIVPDLTVEHRAIDVYAHLGGTVATGVCLPVGGEVCYG